MGHAISHQHGKLRHQHRGFFGKVAGLRAPKFVWALRVGVGVYALMMADVLSKVLLALAYQGIFVVAWAGIALAHIFSPRYDNLFGSESNVATRACPLSIWPVSRHGSRVRSSVSCS